MSALLLNVDDRILLDAVKVDARLSDSDGISIDTTGDGTGDVPYCTSILPVPNFNTLVPPGSATDNQVLDGLAAASSALALRVRPFGRHAESSSNNTSFTSTTDILTTTFAPGEKLAVARTAMAVVNFGCYVDASNTAVEYWLDVDGTSTTRMQYFFNVAGDHRSFGATWLLTLPARTATIKLRAERRSGTGIVYINSDDSASLTLVG
jgi:hypothetical protein